ncbi:olfactory receptor 7C1-like [Sorex araneus]|uniref:olfactory receptor 7C1-like n=1 Tax=Sorex araneus TaxID=42254 RepID=UPI002433D5D1|nr:olfactory receptor 7C1-like [Sorex araneus]
MSFFMPLPTSSLPTLLTPNSAVLCLCAVTGAVEFLLLGLSDDPQVQPVLFGIFLSMYLVTVSGNLLILLAISSDSRLHTPMYFFLSVLSTADISFTSTTVPKVIWDIHTQSRHISHASCLVQLSLYVLCGCLECVILGVMAYDHFVAICHPLHYPIIMNPRLCGWLILGSICISLLNAQLQFLMMSQLIFCSQVEIPHFFCDSPQLLKLACGNICTNNLIIYFIVAIACAECLCAVDPHNVTGAVEFLLLGLSDDPRVQPVLFSLFLSMYLVTVTGNLLIVLAISSDPRLHTPMYLFLSVLSTADICFTSTTVPKAIWDIYTQSRNMSHASCLVQLSLLNIFGCLECVILGVMAYDRFVAICHPLHYPVIINPRICGLLILGSICISLLDSQLQFLMMSQLIFCTRVEIPHFFCDLSQLLRLACGDIFIDNLIIYFIVALLGGVPASGIFYSYTKIISSVLRISSKGGRSKAFSTCVSHLSTVCLFYGTAMGVYLSSAVSQSPRKGAVTSVMYTMVVPMLNPFIYSLRNQDIKRAFQKLLSRTI